MPSAYGRVMGPRIGGDIMAGSRIGQGSALTPYYGGGGLAGYYGSLGGGGGGGGGGYYGSGLGDRYGGYYGSGLGRGYGYSGCGGSGRSVSAGCGFSYNSGRGGGYRGVIDPMCGGLSGRYGLEGGWGRRRGFGGGFGGRYSSLGIGCRRGSRYGSRRVRMPFYGGRSGAGLGRSRGLFPLINGFEDDDDDYLDDDIAPLYRRRVNPLGSSRFGRSLRRQMPLYTNPRMNSLLHGRRYLLDDEWEDDDGYDDYYDDDWDSVGYMDLDEGGAMSGFENFFDGAGLRSRW